MPHTDPRKVLKALIAGLDPESAEPLPNESVLHQAEVIRALLAGFNALDQAAARAQRRSQLPDNVGSAWTTEEESKLVAAFKSGDSPEVIAQKHGRTLRAIEARLQKLGLLTEAERKTRGGFTSG
jgi:DNA-binding NarL/FixJ family response regulator